MEAAFISFLINKFGEIAFEQAQSRCSQLLLQHSTPPLDQIHARIERNFTTFRLMKNFLERSNQSTAASDDDDWTQAVRVVAFKMEDILDEYLYLVGEQRGRTWKNFLSRPSNLCCSLAKAWRGIDSQLENMERDLSRLATAKDLFGNENRVKNPERDTHHYRVCDPMLIDEDDVVGIEENKSKLVSWLTNSDTCREMTAIAVWGMGGQGKTTLVANVYRNNAVKSHFNCQVWVTVSQTYSVEELLRTMIQEILKQKMESVTTMQRLELFEIIRESLQGKRYIIVLDDVWGVDLSNEIGHAFVDNNNGSRIVVTTRKREVARMANEEHIIELQQLDEKDAWTLFCKKAFQRENSKDCPKNLEDYSQRILKKCQGSPLAITVIGSLLSTKEKSESGWKEVYDCLHWEFEKNPSLDALKSIINLSFIDLPNYLKNCFVYCSNFPEDYLIQRKRLIRLWVAEGLIEAKSSNDRVMEEEAEYYLTQLVDRSMLQVAKRNGFGRLKAFRMHDVVREVTLEISKKMRFCMILHGSQSVLDDQTRRLSIQTNDESLDLTSSLLSLSRLRSLVVFSSCNFSSGSLKAVLIRFKTLRVLELQGVQISNLPNEVSALFNLHYLGLRETKVEQLPNNIQKLQSLQTLDLSRSRIKKLPHGVTQLKQLRHLFGYFYEIEFGGSTVVGCFPTLEGACQWRKLQTLKSVKANEKLAQLLGDLKELRSLQVMAVEQAHCPQLCTSLTKMSNLRNLYLKSDASERKFNVEMSNCPPPLLEKLVLFGRLFEGKMPKFICSCAELTHVCLSHSKLIEDPLPSFGQLPKLAELRLANAYDGQKLHFKTDWFRNLKRLALIGMENLHDIVIEEGAMTSLRELRMSYLRELKVVPSGIEFLTHLETLILQKLSEELMEKLRKDDDNEDRQRIRHILNVDID